MTKSVCQFAAILSASLAAGGVVSGCARTARCVRFDIAGSPPEIRAQAKDPKNGWIQGATICDTGAYFVVTSAEADKRIMVLQKGNGGGTLFIRQDGASALFDADKKRGLRGLVARLDDEGLFVFNADGKGHVLDVKETEITFADPETGRMFFHDTRPKSGRATFSYSSYDASRNAWIELSDLDRNGSIDVRDTDVAGQPRRREFWVGDRWLDLVERDGRKGVILDGQFMGVGTAREIVEGKSKR